MVLRHRKWVCCQSALENSTRVAIDVPWQPCVDAREPSPAGKESPPAAGAVAQLKRTPA